MKKILAAVFLVFISVLFIGTTGKIAREALGYARVDGIEKGFIHLRDTVKTLESSYQQKLIGHNNFISFTGAFNRAICSDAVPSVNKENSVYRLKNGYIAFAVNGFKEFNENQKNDIDSVTKSAKDTGAELLFVSVPPKVCKTEDFTLRGIKNYEYEIIDYRINYFENQGYDILNLHEKLHEENLEHYSLFYRTDHHWNADAGLWASEKISDWLEVKGFDTDSRTFSKDNYNEIIIEDLFLGSQGKQVGPFYAGTDDFKYYVPLFPTDYSAVFFDGKEYSFEGDFVGTVFDKKKLTKNYFYSFNYSSFLRGDFALTKIENNINKNGTKILMIKDSFTNVLATYFAAECSELHLIDPRHYKDSISEYIKENDFDVVIVSLSARMGNNVFEWENKE